MKATPKKAPEFFDACKGCEAQVVIAPKPAQPIERGLPGPGLLAQVVADKYHDHLPLYRSEQRFERLGVTLPRSTMCDCATKATPKKAPELFADRHTCGPRNHKTTSEE